MKLFIKLTVALMIGSMLLVAPAGANTTITTHTKLTVNDKSVKAGTKVNWKIEVNAKNKKCYANQKVKWFKNGHCKHYKQLGANGIVKFKKKMWNTSKYQARYPGRHFGVHPHRHVCDPSRSKVIKITVKK